MMDNVKDHFIALVCSCIITHSFQSISFFNREFGVETMTLKEEIIVFSSCSHKKKDSQSEVSGEENHNMKMIIQKPNQVLRDCLWRLMS